MRFQPAACRGRASPTDVFRVSSKGPLLRPKGLFLLSSCLFSPPSGPPSSPPFSTPVISVVSMTCPGAGEVSHVPAPRAPGGPRDRLGSKCPSSKDASPSPDGLWGADRLAFVRVEEPAGPGADSGFPVRAPGSSLMGPDPARTSCGWETPPSLRDARGWAFDGYVSLSARQLGLPRRAFMDQLTERLVSVFSAGFLSSFPNPVHLCSPRAESCEAFSGRVTVEIKLYQSERNGSNILEKDISVLNFLGVDRINSPPEVGGGLELPRSVAGLQRLIVHLRPSLGSAFLPWTPPLLRT